MGALEGLTVLLLEDEFLIALEAEEMLRTLGAAQVEIAYDLEEADRLVGAMTFDAAMLDINVNGKMSFPLANKLKDTGAAILFATGYEPTSKRGQFEGEAAYITKPYSIDRLDRAFTELLASRHPRPALARINGAGATHARHRS